MEPHQELVLLGKVTKPHGIRGELKVYPYSGVPENFVEYSTVLLAADEETAPIAYTVERARVQKNCVLLQLNNCTTRNDSEALVNSLVFVSVDELPELADREFYLRDLENKEMITEQGLVIGRVAGILSGKEQDLAQVVQGKREYMIPLVPEFIIKIDDNRVVVALPPGLLEINM
jgi:16S rRNA processing protein RimM